MEQLLSKLVDKEIDIASIAKLEPAFEGTPVVNEDGFLVVKGSYPTQPSKLFFELNSKGGK